MCIITNIIFIVHHAQRKQARKVPLPRHVASQKILYKMDSKQKNLLICCLNVSRSQNNFDNKSLILSYKNVLLITS